MVAATVSLSRVGRTAFVDRMVRRLLDQGYPGQAVNSILLPLYVNGVALMSGQNRENLISLLGLDPQERKEFRIYFFGGDE